jgi:hypothetical protein
MTHNELIPYAAMWLRKKHTIVVTEIVSGAGEEPDAIGFNSCVSTLVECKATRADFRTDKKKSWRRNPDRAMGTYRYYLAPEGVVPHDEVPANWGLLEVTAKGRVKCVVHPNGMQGYRRRAFVKDSSKEVSLLASVIRRIGQLAPRGVSVRCYQYTTKNKTTVGIEPDRISPLELVNGGGI